jgi:2-octaprenyl-6-methoxyphenol hydroxylase
MAADAEATTDLAVVGGGLVGCSLALALARQGRAACLIEAAAQRQAPPPGFDERNLALARASLDALAQLGVLQRLARPPEPITRIHVSRSGDLGSVQLRAAEHGVEAFGAVAMARDLGVALQQAVAADPMIEVRDATRVIAIEAVDDGWRLQLQQAGAARSLHCRLLVAADGSDSPLRGWLGIGEMVDDYYQQLLVCSVQPASAERGQAWERFSAHGPVALLPRNDGCWGAVCGVPDAQADQVLALSDQGYADYLQQRFGWRAGRLLRAGRRQAYPLRRRVAQRLVGRRAVLVGNAAQTLHPVGAQGFNLGLRDALTLASGLRGVEDPGTPTLLEAYAAARREDRARTLAFSHGLARLTALETAPAHLLRSLGLLVLGASRRARAPLVQAAMGLTGMPAEWRGGSA